MAFLRPGFSSSNLIGYIPRLNVGIVGQRQRGFSLVETLIGIVLLGFLIPMLFFSYANFTGMMVIERERIAVTHAGSQFLNRLSQELSQTRTISPNSDGDHLYFAYYDPIRDEVIKRGYRLEANGTGRKKLIQLRYNDTSRSWQEVSAYSYALSDEISLPASVSFDYCLAADCSVAPERSLSVKLSGWQFFKTNSDSASGGAYFNELDLPDLEYFLASALTGDVLLSEEPRQLFSFGLVDAFGTGADGRMMILGEEGKELLMPRFSAPTGSGVTDVMDVQSVTSGAPAGRRNYSMSFNTNTGEVFWWDQNWGSNEKLHRWQGGTLSTLVNRSESNQENIVSVDSNTGRVFLGGGNDNFQNWLNGTLSGTLNPAVSSVIWNNIVDVRDSRLFLSASYPGNTPGQIGRLYRWSQPTGYVSMDTGYRIGEKAMVYDAQNRRLFYGQQYSATTADASVAEMRIWNNSGVISTILSNAAGFPGSESIELVRSTGRVYFGDYNPVGRFYTWNPGDGNATDILGANVGYPGYHSLGVHQASGRVYFGSGTNFYTWAPGVGLSTILTSAGDYPGYYSTAVDQNTGRVFFGEYKVSGNFYTWAASTGLSTLVSGRAYPGARSIAVDQLTGRAFWGEGGSSGRFYTWLNGTLSTLVSGVPYPGYESVALDPNTGRAYFGTSYNTVDANLYTWANGTLSTVMSGVRAPGGGNLSVDPTSGRVWFDYGTTPRKMAYWSAGAAAVSASAVKKSNAFGEPQSQGIAMKYEAGSYLSGTQDPTGDLYLVNNTAQTVDRYRYVSIEGQYKLISQFSWATYAQAVNAIVIDPSGNGLALLAQNLSGQWGIQKYANRAATGTPAAPTTFNLSVLGTPVIANPTGLAINARTGDFLVIDCGVAVDTVKRRLFQIDGSAGTVEQTFLVDVSNANLSTNSMSESNFKLAYNEEDNLLYLIAPTLGNVYGLALSKYI